MRQPVAHQGRRRGAAALSLLVALSLAAVLVACGGDASPPEGPPAATGGPSATSALPAETAAGASTPSASPTSTATPALGASATATGAAEAPEGATQPPTSTPTSTPGQATASPTSTPPPAATVAPTTAPRGGGSRAADPALWERSLVIGMADRPGGAAELAAGGVASARYQYLSGGVGQGWTTWSNGGNFVRNYVHESASAGLVPVFTYYMLVQSAPDSLAERDRPLMALGDAGLVEGYFRELEEFFRAAAASSAVVLHLEPDAWGFAEQAAGEASEVRVAMEGARDIVGGGYQATLPGFARAVLDLRDRLAPNVQVAYHLSHWGSGEDPMRSNASMSRVDSLAGAASDFYRSLAVPFDLVFTDIADRDSGFFQHIYGMGDEAWWDDQDFARHVRYLGNFTGATGLPAVLWQIPYGNTRMRALDNTWNHFQDNRVEWLLDDPSRANLGAYVRAGVIALLFGRGADGATDASDANGDGITDPPAINGNARASLSADDDGGFFRERAREYYRQGPLPLP